MKNRIGLLGMKVVAVFAALVLALGFVVGTSTIAPQEAQAKVTTQAKAAKRKAIGKKKAIRIALKDAGFKKSQVKRLKVEVDREDGHKIYEVEFKKGKYEYEYDIAYYSGKILDKEVERTKR